MTERNTQPARARAAEQDDAGFDVWLPALVAIATAFFLILSASAQEASPRPIYNVERFTMSEAERTRLEEQAARAADDLERAATHMRAVHQRVEMQALPEIRAAIADAEAAAVPPQPVVIAQPVVISGAASSAPSPGWLRLAMALAIAAMLGGALYLLDRTWRRTGPLLPAEQAAA